MSLKIHDHLIYIADNSSILVYITKRRHSEFSSDWQHYNIHVIIQQITVEKKDGA